MQGLYGRPLRPPVTEENILIEQYRRAACEIYRIFKLNCEVAAS